MKRNLLILAALIAAPSYASAADTTPFHDWTGPYAGINLGAAWSDVEALSNDHLSFTGGALLGYNFQMQNLVLGLEADLSYLGMGREESITFMDDTALVLNGSVESDWFGTLRGRMGFALDDFLIYGTAGLAYGQMDVDWRAKFYDEDDNVSKSSSLTSELNWGWTAGAGVEYALDRWSIGLEYLYVDLGETDWEAEFEFDYGMSSTSITGKGSIEHNVNVVRATAKLLF